MTPVYTEAEAQPRFTSWDWLTAKPPGVYALVAAPGLRLRSEPLWSEHQIHAPGALVQCAADGGDSARGGSWIVPPPWAPRAWTYSTGVCRWIEEPQVGKHVTEFAQVVSDLRAWRDSTASVLLAFDQMVTFERVAPTCDRLYLIVRTDHPYLLDSGFTPADVFVLSPRGRIATLDQHPEFDRWRFGVQTGELWASLGEAWVDALVPPGATS